MIAGMMCRDSDFHRHPRRARCVERISKVLFCTVILLGVGLSLIELYLFAQAFSGLHMFNNFMTSVSDHINPLNDDLDTNAEVGTTEWDDYTEDAEQRNETQKVQLLFQALKDARNQDTNKYPKLKRFLRDTRYKDDGFFSLAFGDDACKLPNGLETAEILCKKFPSSMTCKAYCAYGYTYREGIVRTHDCTYSRNKWSKDFEECKPFVDCKLRLTTPGSLICVQNTALESPICEISCEMYEDKDPVESQRYTCKIDGTWKPALPYCVTRRGLKVVRAPEVKQHANLTFPET